MLPSVPVICSRKNRRLWTCSTLLAGDEEAVAIHIHLQELLQVMTAFALGTAGRHTAGSRKGKPLFPGSFRLVWVSSPLNTLADSKCRLMEVESRSQ